MNVNIKINRKSFMNLINQNLYRVCVRQEVFWKKYKFNVKNISFK